MGVSIVLQFGQTVELLRNSFDLFSTHNIRAGPTSFRPFRVLKKTYSFYKFYLSRFMLLLECILLL